MLSFSTNQRRNAREYKEKTSEEVVPSTEGVASQDGAGTVQTAGNAVQSGVDTTASTSRKKLTIQESDIAKTGDLYPEKLLRPSGRFKNDKSECREVCAKFYRSSTHHSPGFSTVQCASEHPKVIGVSVMDKNESLATAINGLFTAFRYSIS